MRELRASSAFANGPDASGSGFQLFVDANEAAGIEFDSCLHEPNPIGVRDAANGHEQVAAVNLLVAPGRTHGHGNRLSGSTFNADRLGVHQDLDALASQNLQNFFGDVSIFSSHELAAGFDDRYPAAEAAIGLRHVDPNIAAAGHDQV